MAPQLKTMLASFPEIALVEVDSSLVPQLAEKFTIFTVPTVVFFIDGKEMLRQSRFIVMGDLAQKLQRFIQAYSG